MVDGSSEQDFLRSYCQLHVLYVWRHGAVKKKAFEICDDFCLVSFLGQGPVRKVLLLHVLASYVATYMLMQSIRFM